MNGGSKADIRLDFEHRVTKLEADVDATAKALALQRSENDRRLTELNGEAGRLRTIQQTYTSADSFDALDARVKILEGAQFAYAGRRETQTEDKGQSNVDRGLFVAVVAVLVTIIVGIAGVVAAYIVTHR